MSVLANDPFHPGQLTTQLIDPLTIASTQLLGYGDSPYGRQPVVRLIYTNQSAEDVFDAWHLLHP